MIQNGNNEEALRLYLAQSLNLLSAKTHHLGAIAAREAKDTELFSSIWRYAKLRKDYDDDTHADFHRDHALLLASTGGADGVIDDDLAMMQSYRTRDTTDALVDEIAISRIEISRDFLMLAYDRLITVHNQLHTSDKGDDPERTQAHRDALWWECLASGLCGDRKSHRLAKSIFWMSDIYDPKLKRRAIAFVIMVCPSSLRKQLITRLLRRA